MTEVMTTKKPKKQKTAYPFPVELIDQLLAQVENKDAESILGESGLAGQLKKMLAERTLSAELNHHFANEEDGGKNHRNGSSPKKVLTRRRASPGHPARPPVELRAQGGG
jgi:putative transposase